MPALGARRCINVTQNNMKFVVETVKNSGRLGYLVPADTGAKYATPLLLQTTKSGQPPNLCREAFDELSKDVHVLQLTMTTMNTMSGALKAFDGDVSTYVGFANFPTAMTIRDPCELMRGGGNDKDIVPLFTRHGKLDCSAEQYMDMIELFKPNIYQGLNDADTNFESAKKRVQKSVERTEQFMEYCYDRHKNSDYLQKSALYAPIAGGYNKFARFRSIKHAKEKGGDVVSGYVLEGFHSYGLSATEVTTTMLLPIVQLCLDELDTSKPKLMPGAFTPIVTLELIRLAVDIFDTSYACCAAANFKALVFSFDLNGQDKGNGSPFLDLTDESLREEFTPFLSGCECLACRNHTRAYAHHLYKTKELLGPILLMIHNLHHYIRFFDKIRSCIAQDKLDDLINLVKYQLTDKEVDYRIYENTKIISKTSTSKGFGL